MSGLYWIDFHTHIDQKSPLEFLNNDVLRIVSTPLEETMLPAEKNVLYTLELHPWHGSTPDEYYRKLAADSKFSGIGEVGLDRIKGKLPLDEQMQILEDVILLAEAVKKPLVIHCVKCFSELLYLYKKIGWQIPTAIHYYRSNLAQARQLWQNTHFILSLPPAVYTQKELLEFLRDNPEYLQRIVLETDDPCHGNIVKHYQTMAEFFNMDVSELQQLIQQNVERFYHVGNF